MRLIIAAALAATLAACAHNDGVIHYSGNPTDRHTTADGTVLDGTGRVVNTTYHPSSIYSPAKVDVCDPTFTNPYLISECRDKRIAAGEQVGPLEPAIQQKIFEDRRMTQAQDVAEQRARAECSYETTANMTNFRGGILMDIATRNNLYNLCMQAKGSTSH